MTHNEKNVTNFPLKKCIKNGYLIRKSKRTDRLDWIDIQFDKVSNTFYDTC